MAEISIALGGNQGDRAALLDDALARMAAFVTISKRSAVYETAPKYVTDQPAFLNMAVAGSTELAPHDLLAALKEIEAALGRTDGPRNGPRPIDLDILFYDDLQLDTPDLTIPHPRIAERRFVLQPLHDIAPGLSHPSTGKTVSEMLAALPEGDEEDVRMFEAARS